MKTLHYAGFQPNAAGFGWATCNANLRTELGKLFQLVEAPPADIVFMPLADHDFNPVTPARGEINLAYTFFEYPLGPNAEKNAAKYDIVFCGSTWCQDRLRDRGITNTDVLIQGVDQGVFHPPKVESRKAKVENGEFRIFSGGKFEYRKGQDLVISAFKEFSKTHPEAHLVCSWFNPWPQLIVSALHGCGLSFPLGAFEDQMALFADVLYLYGLAPSQFTILPRLSQQKLAAEMANTDIALFPNRCEGGTNLVLMEYAATGRPIVANELTGHADVSNLITFPIQAIEAIDHWAVQSVDNILEALEAAFSLALTSNSYLLTSAHARASIPAWSCAAEKIASTLDTLAHA